MDIKEAIDLRNSFISLMEQKNKEQVYQDFLEKHPPFIPREFVQNHGIHFSLVFRKLSLAKDYTMDFFYLSKSSDDWNCVLIEIEKPHSKFFKENSNDFHEDFNHALSQIRRWRSWFQNNSNYENFINNTLSVVRVPDVMTRNPCHIKYVLVHGRRDEYFNNPVRSGLIHAEERDNFKIITYDSLIEDLKSKGNLYVAIRRNEYIDIISEQFVDESLFSWVSHSYIRITHELKKDIMRHKSTWHHYRMEDGEKKLALEIALPKLALLN